MGLRVWRVESTLGLRRQNGNMLEVCGVWGLEFRTSTLNPNTGAGYALARFLPYPGFNHGRLLQDIADFCRIKFRNSGV